MVQLGVLTTEFERSSLEDNLDAVASHGIGGRPVPAGVGTAGDPAAHVARDGPRRAWPHLDEQLCDRIREQLAARGIALAAVDGTFNMVGPDVARRRENLGHLRRLIELCGVLGTSTVTLCTGSRAEIMWRRHPDNDSAETWADLVSVTSEAARTAERHGVVLAFEPEVNNVVNSAQRARRLLDDVGSPAVKVLMDPANIFQAGELARMQDKLEEAFALLAGDIALAHAKDLDHDGEAGHLGAGRGALDYPLYLSLLQKSGFDGVLVLHQLRGLSDADIGSCFSYVRSQAPPGYVA